LSTLRWRDAPKLEEAEALIIVCVLEEVNLRGEEEGGVDAVTKEEAFQLGGIYVSFLGGTGGNDMVAVGIMRGSVNYGRIDGRLVLFLLLHWLLYSCLLFRLRWGRGMRGWYLRKIQVG
jgi:hypothetical protein